MNKIILLGMTVLTCSDLIAGNAVSPTVAEALPVSTAPAPCCGAAKKARDGRAVESPARPAVISSSHSLYQVDSTWTDDHGASVQIGLWRGHAVILAMFFARCEYACPLIVSDIQRTLAALPPNARAQTRVLLVSFDSARDTPAALREYRRRATLDSAWTLLRGEAGAVQELAMLLGVKYKEDARGQFSHSNLITVLNRAGEITYQRAGLQGDVSELAKAVVLAAD